MSPEEYANVHRIFDAARRRPLADRAAYLDNACGSNPALRHEVESLLGHDRAPESFLDRPILNEGVRAAIGPQSSTPLDQTAPVDDSRVTLPGPDAIVPQRIGEFTIRRVLGRGGMGVVYLAEQQRPQRTVALKVMRNPLGTTELLRRFALEADVLGRLHHPSIAQIFSVGTAPQRGPAGELIEQPFFAMEFVDGVPLNAHVRQDALPTEKRVALLATICDAIHHAHQKGVIHRDLKPANILITPEGTPKVLDFGVARAVDPDLQATTLHTGAGQIIGTIPYMSPEQIAGRSDEVDIRSDVFALGCIAYELFSGRLPFDVTERSVAEAARIIHEDDPSPMSSVNRTLRGDLETIVNKALEKEPERRYASAAELAADLRRYLHDEPITARPPSSWYQVRKFAKRNRALVASVATVFAVLVVFAVTSTALALRATRAESLAASRLSDTQAALQLADERRDEAEQALALAETRREQAITAQRNAQAEAEHALAVRTFLVEMLERASPHVAAGGDVTVLRAVLEDAEVRLDDLRDYPIVLADLHVVIGRVYRDLADFDKAEKHLLAGHALYEQEGVEEGDLLEILSSLGALRDDQHRFDEAREIYTELLERSVEAYGPFHKRSLKARYQIVGTKFQQGDLHHAAAETRAVLADVIAHHGADCDLANEIRGGLGLTLMRAGHFDEAVEMFEYLDSLFQDQYGHRHPTRLIMLKHLAQALEKAGELDRSKEAHREQIALYTEVYGAAHWRTVEAKINLCTVLSTIGDYAAAETLATEAVEAAREALGPDHGTTAKALHRLAIAQRLQSKLSAAHATFTQLVPLAERLYGEDDVRTLNIRGSYAGVLMQEGRIDEAISIVEQTVAANTRMYGASSIQALQQRYNLAVLNMKRGTYQAAIEILKAIIPIVDDAAPPDHWFRWELRGSLGRSLASADAVAEALPHLHAALDGLTRTLGEDNPKTRQVHDALETLRAAGIDVDR